MAGCRYRCIYCNQYALHPDASHEVTGDDVLAAAEKYARFTRDINAYESREIAFYGGNFCGLPPVKKTALLKAAGRACELYNYLSIRVSTRPDSMTAAEASFLRENGVGLVEIGAQSMDGEVLKRSSRGHGPDAVVSSVAMLRDAGLGVGLHQMLGLPGAAFGIDVESARRIAAQKPDTVRVHPTLVLAGSGLEASFRAGRYTPLTLDEAAARTAAVLKVYNDAGIPVIRVGLHPDDELISGRAVVAGPYHPAFREYVEKPEKG